MWGADGSSLLGITAGLRASFFGVDRGAQKGAEGGLEGGMHENNRLCAQCTLQETARH